MSEHSLKRKMEDTLLQVIHNAGLYSGTRLRSDEERTTKLQLPCVVAQYVPQGRTGSMAMEKGLLLLLVKSHADTEDDTDEEDEISPTAAELAHAEFVQQVRSSVHVADFAGVLTAAGVAGGFPLAVLQALVSTPPEPEPENGAFLYAFAWETAAVDQDCS